MMDDQTIAVAAPRSPRRAGWTRWLLPLFVVLLGIAVYALAMRARAPATPAPAGRNAANRVTPVAVARAHLGDVPIYVNGLGSVTAFYAVTVKTRVDGQLMRVAAAEGSLVHQNDLVAEIDPRPFDVAVTQMEGTLARDRALLENAHRDLSRYESLIGQDAVPRQQLDTQASTVAQLEGTVKADEGQLASARLQRDYCRVIAPITGRVGLRLVDPGNIVHAADANGLLVITQVQPIAVLFAVAEDALPAILRRLHGGATLPVDAFNRDGTQKLSTGHLATSDNQVDPTTGTVKLKAIFDNADAALFPNQFVNARLTVDVQHGKVLVPPSAVRRGAQGSFVYLVQGDGGPAGGAAGAGRSGASASTVRLRAVTVGTTQPDAVSIESGLAAGDRVVTDGLDDLRDGSRVQVAPSKGAPAPAATTAPSASTAPAAPSAPSVAPSKMPPKGARP